MKIALYQKKDSFLPFGLERAEAADRVHKQWQMLTQWGNRDKVHRQLWRPRANMVQGPQMLRNLNPGNLDRHDLTVTPFLQPKAKQNKTEDCCGLFVVHQVSFSSIFLWEVGKERPWRNFPDTWARVKWEGMSCVSPSKTPWAEHLLDCNQDP